MHKRRSSSPHIVSIVVLLFLLIGGGVTAYFAITTSEVELKLIGNKNIIISEKEDYEEPGYYARHCMFSRCHDLTSKVVVKTDYLPEIKARVVGEYDISYNLDYLGKSYSELRTVTFSDTNPPELTLSGSEAVGLYYGQTYYEPGFSASDDVDGDLTDKVEVIGEVNPYEVGVYKLSYSVKDSSGNVTEKSRRVFVYNYYAFTPDPITTFEELEQYIEESGWDISFGYKDLNSGYTYTRDADRVFYGASLVKALDAMYVYEHFGGPRNSSERLLLTNAVSYSNNGAHLSLANSLGVGNLRNYADEIGMNLHLKGSIYYGDTYAFCDTSVNDQLAEWTHLWELINTLDNGYELQNYYTLVYSWSDLNFYGSVNPLYKAGFYGTFHHETGIFPVENPYIITILSTMNYRGNIVYILKDLSERVYLINEARHL